MDKDSPPSKAMTDKLLKHTKFDQRFSNILATYCDRLARLCTADEEAIKRTVEKYNKSHDLLTKFHEIYCQYLTADEVLDYIAFLKTPTGQKIIAHEDDIKADMLRAAVNMALDIGVQIQRDYGGPVDPKYPGIDLQM